MAYKSHKKPKIKSNTQAKQLKLDFRVNILSNYIKQREEVFKKEAEIVNHRMCKL